MTHTPVKIQFPKNENGLKFTPFGGALLINELFEKLELSKAIDENIGVRSKIETSKYSDSIYIKSLVMMQAIGGDTVDDLKLVRNDSVIQGIMGPIPGKTSVHNFLSEFNDPAEEAKRGMGRSFVPEMKDCLKGFNKITEHLLNNIPAFGNIDTITLDQDATFIPTCVTGALYNYKSQRSFEAFNTYIPEYDIMLLSEFRDGNVAPGYRQLENLVESLKMLPASVRKVRLRSDTAGYQIGLIKYCAEGRNERFGAIEFAIGTPVTKALREAVKATKEDAWSKVSPLSKQECAEIAFAPNNLSFSKNGPDYRFIVIREELDANTTSAHEALQTSLFDDDYSSDSPLAPLHPTAMNGKVYKVFAVITNTEGSCADILTWYHGRCGKSEEIHRVLKDDLAGGHVVTGSLGANAAWWQIAVLTANILSIIKSTILPSSHRSARPKKLRAELFSLVARLTFHARKQVVQIYRTAANRLFCDAWEFLSRFRFCLE